MGIDYLFIDALTLPQYPHVNIDELVLFVELFSYIRVITTFVATEWEHDEECPSYPLRGWLLVESNRYLNNSQCTLRDLFTIRTGKRDIHSNETSEHGCQYAILQYATVFLKPYFTHPANMPTRDDCDRPVSELFIPYSDPDIVRWNGGGRRYCYAHSICEALCQGGKIAFDVGDLLKTGTNVLYGQATTEWLLNLYAEIDSDEGRSIFFLPPYLCTFPRL